MAVSVTIQFPEVALQPGRARATLRETLNNAIRPPLRNAVEELHRVGRYQSISDRWRFTQETTGDGATYGLYNDARASRYLIPGTRPHDIQMPPHVAPIDALLAWAFHEGLPESAAFAAQRNIAAHGQTLHHPGLSPDRPVLDVLDRAQAQVDERLVAYYSAWAAKWGQEEIGAGG